MSSPKPRGQTGGHRHQPPPSTRPSASSAPSHTPSGSSASSKPRSERLVTVIECLSPSNKLGAGLIAYKRKRDDLLHGGVNVVEINLVRRGDWRALLSPYQWSPDAESIHRITVSTR